MEIQAEFRAKVRKRRSEERSARHRLMTAFGELFQIFNTLGEFDPGSGRTLAACLTHASHGGPQGQPANGCVTREQPTSMWGIAGPTAG